MSTPATRGITPSRTSSLLRVRRKNGRRAGEVQPVKGSALGSRQSPRLVRPSISLARCARLARYAVPQRVRNARFEPHNGLVRFALYGGRVHANEGTEGKEEHH